MADNNELLLEVLIENRKIKAELEKSKENSTFWWNECTKAREELQKTKEPVCIEDVRDPEERIEVGEGERTE